MPMAERTVTKQLWQICVIQQQQKEICSLSARKQEMLNEIKEGAMQQYKCNISKMIIIKKEK